MLSAVSRVGCLPEMPTEQAAAPELVLEGLEHQKGSPAQTERLPPAFRHSLQRRHVSPSAPVLIAAPSWVTHAEDSLACTLVSFDRAVPIIFSPLATCLVHFLVPTPATSARENALAACTSGFTTFFTCFRLSLRQSGTESFTPAVINVLKVPAVTLGPAWHWPPLHWSSRVHSMPSLHDLVFAAYWHPVAGSHTSSVQGFPSSQPPTMQRADGIVVEV